MIPSDKVAITHARISSCPHAQTPTNAKSGETGKIKVGRIAMDRKSKGPF